MERLVVVDISPSLTSVHTSFLAYIQAMKEVKIASNIPRSTARRLAEDQLRKLVKVTILTRTVWTFISSFFYCLCCFYCNTRINHPHLCCLQERSVRQFLLTNLEEQNGHYGWRINLEAISNHLEDIMGFPHFSNTYEGPTLFLGGSSSAYIR